MEKYIPKVGDYFRRPPLATVCICRKVDDYYVHYSFYDEHSQTLKINKNVDFELYSRKYIPELGEKFLIDGIGGLDLVADQKMGSFIMARTERLNSISIDTDKLSFTKIE